MRSKSHLKLLLFATIAWFAFVIIGLPNYYTDWPFKKLLYFCIAAYIVLGLITYRFVIKYTNRISRVFWFAFYITAPLIIYDSLYIHFVLKVPVDFVNRFWFLSVFYIIPWIQAPVIYWYLNKKLSRNSWGLIGVAYFIIAGLLWIWWATFEGGFFDTMIDYPERNSTMLGSAFICSLYGTFLFLSLIRFSNIIKFFSGKCT